MSEQIAFTVQPQAVIGAAPSFEFRTPEMTTRDILEQATEYLRDRWVPGHWYVFSDGVPDPAGDPSGVYPAGQVTSACSMGALLLAKQLQGAERLGTDLWELLCEADPAFHRALVLLVRQVGCDLEDYGELLTDGTWVSPDDCAELPAEELVSIITNWNDEDERRHEEVIIAFVAATKGAIKEEETGAR